MQQSIQLKEFRHHNFMVINNVYEDKMSYKLHHLS